MNRTLDAKRLAGKTHKVSWPPLRIFAPRYWLTLIALTVFRVLVLLPTPVLFAIGTGLGRVLYYILGKFSRTARRNMALCLPALADTEREFLIKRHFESLGIGLFETALCWWGSTKRIRALSKVEGIENLEAALAKGKGVLLLSAHFTTLEIGARILSTVTPINIMYRPSNNECLAFFLSRNRGRLAKRAIPRDDIRTLVTALRANECVWYAPDQSYRKKGAEMVRMFGIPAATNTATSRLAALTGATVLPYFAERLPGQRGYRAVIHPPIEGFPSGNPVLDAERFNHLIEQQVRVTPDQYLWIHKRFKGLSADYPDYYGRSIPKSV